MRSALVRPAIVQVPPAQKFLVVKPLTVLIIGALKSVGGVVIATSFEDVTAKETSAARSRVLSKILMNAVTAAGNQVPPLEQPLQLTGTQLGAMDPERSSTTVMATGARAATAVSPTVKVFHWGSNPMKYVWIWALAQLV